MSYRYYLRIHDQQGHRVEFSGPDVEQIYHQLPGILEALGMDVYTDSYVPVYPPENAPSDSQGDQDAPSDPPDDPQHRYGLCLRHNMAYTMLTGDNVPVHLWGDSKCFGVKLTSSQLSALEGA